MTKEIDIDKLINMNYRVLTLLGYASALLHQCNAADCMSSAWKDHYLLFIKSGKCGLFG